MSEGKSQHNIALLERVKALVDYLRSGPTNLQSVIHFVAVDTLFPISAFAVTFNVVRLDGTIYIPAWHGFTNEQIQSVPERFVSFDSPLNRSLRTGTVVASGSFEDFLFSGPGYAEALFPKGFPSSLAWPIPGYGSVVTFCSKELEVSLEIELFLLTVGGLLSLEIGRTDLAGTINREEPGINAVGSTMLTSRQWTIAQAMRRGLTNPAIAKDLGLSESLVRHETMNIYRKLKISGRKELIEDVELDSLGGKI